MDQLTDEQQQWQREKEALETRAKRAEEELKIVKALLLLKNVDVQVDLNKESNIRETLAGDPALLQELMKIRDKIKLLQHTCLLLRAEVLFLKEDITLTTKWVHHATEKAMVEQAQERQNLQSRIEKLVQLFQ